jgi:hypothetical protein
MPPLDPDDKDDIEQALNERRLLNQLRLRSFTVTPAVIQPFGQAILAWDVIVPAGVAREIDVRFMLAGVAVPNPGAKAVSPLASGAFQLIAQSPRSTRILGSRVLQVETGDCQPQAISREAIQVEAQPVKTLLTAGVLTSRGDVAVSLRPPDALLIEVPLKAAIPNFPDADVDVGVTIAVSTATRRNGDRVAAAKLRAVAVDVIFHALEHVISHGAATAAQALIQPLAADLIRSFVGPQIEATVTPALQAFADLIVTGARRADPANRPHRLFSITVEPEGLFITACPVPSRSAADGRQAPRRRRRRRSADGEGRTPSRS